MNKKKFIKILKEKLAILDDNEVLDIIDKNTNIIDEKIKNGKTEEEAIADFGNINEFVEEILKAYKINLKYNKESDNIQEDFESLIKKGTNKLSDFVNKIIENIKNNDKITIELVSEIIIKTLILIVILVILRLPFILITKLGEIILNIDIFYLGSILCFIWNLLVWILYFVVSVIIAITLFKDNLKSSNKKEVILKNKKKVVEKSPKISASKDDKIVVKKEHSLTKILLNILKIFVFLVVLLPLLLIILGLTLGLGLTIYYLFIGLNLWGILLVLIGCNILFGTIFQFIYGLLNKKTKHLFPIFISIIIISIGSLMTFDMARKLEYSGIDTSIFNQVVLTKEYSITDNTNVSLDGRITKEIDNTLLDDKIIIEISYFDEIIYLEENSDKNIRIQSYSKSNGKTLLKIYDNIINNLKNNKVNEYSALNEVVFKIKANEKTIKNVRIN